MKKRIFGKTNIEVSEVGLGTWQLGGSWGEVTESTAFDILQTAADNGVTFFDTADVYGDGKSERLIGQFMKKIQNIFLLLPKLVGEVILVGRKILVLKP